MLTTNKDILAFLNDVEEEKRKARELKKLDFYKTLAIKAKNKYAEFLLQKTEYKDYGDVIYVKLNNGCGGIRIYLNMEGREDNINQQIMAEHLAQVIPSFTLKDYETGHIHGSSYYYKLYMQPKS